MFDILMATKLLAGPERESAREQLRALPRFAAASARLAAAVRRTLRRRQLVGELSLRYLDQFAHLSEAGARMDDLAVSVAAALVFEACNVGLRPVGKAGVPALTRARLSHVDQELRPAHDHLGCQRRAHRGPGQGRVR